MLLKPEEPFSVPPTHKTQLQEPSEEISAFKSEETSVTDQTQLILLKDKSVYGLNHKSNANGKTTLNNGFTNDGNDCE